MTEKINRKLILNKNQIEGIRESGKVNTHLLDFISDKLCIGMSTLEIDQLIYNETRRLGGVPATLDYNGFPRSLCTSINDQVCHGIPSKNVILKNGDLFNIDVSTLYKGYYSDAARVFSIGEMSSKNEKLMTVSKKCIDVGLAVVKPWKSMKEIGRVITEFAEKKGFSIAEGIGGHGIGLNFHEEPYVSFDRYGTDVLLEPGMVFTIEPAVNAGACRIFEDAENGWTIYTLDGSNSAQWEVTVLVTDDSYEILSY